MAEKKPTNETQALLNFFVAHKDDADNLFAFCKQNNEGLNKLFIFLYENPEGMDRTLNQGSTEKGRADLLARLPDAQSREALGFILDHAAEFKATSQFLVHHSLDASSVVDLMANNAKELLPIVKFAVAHPKELSQLAAMAEKEGPDSTSTLMGFLKTPSLWGFSIKHASELAAINSFISKHQGDLNVSDSSPEEEKDIQKLTGFISKNEDKLAALAQGFNGLKTGLTDFIHTQQEQAVAEKHQAQVAQERAKEEGDMVNKFLALKKVDPKAFAEASALEYQAIEIARGPKNAEGFLTSYDEIREWRNKYNEFMGKLKSGDPDPKIMSPIHFHDHPEDIAAIKPALDPGAVPKKMEASLKR